MGRWVDLDWWQKDEGIQQSCRVRIMYSGPALVPVYFTWPVKRVDFCLESGRAQPKASAPTQWMEVVDKKLFS